MATNFFPSLFEGTIDGFERIALLREAFEAGHIDRDILRGRKPVGMTYAEWYLAIGRDYNNVADWYGMPPVKLADWQVAAQRERAAADAAAAEYGW